MGRTKQLHPLVDAVNNWQKALKEKDLEAAKEYENIVDRLCKAHNPGQPYTGTKENYSNPFS